MKKDYSKLSDHQFKKGILYTPFNSNLGETLHFSPWALEWLPEYIWLSLIMEYYGREKGIELVGMIIKELSEKDKILCTPMLSEILSLENEKQRNYYEIVCKWISPNILSPLTLIFRLDKHVVFNEYFLEYGTTIDQKITVLQSVIKKNLFHQTNEATDIRFLVLWFGIYSDKIHFASGMDITNALVEYSRINHDHPKMSLYRSLIRATEIAMRIEEKNRDLPKQFWDTVGILTRCEPLIIDYGEEGSGNVSFFEDATNTIEFLLANNKEKLLSDEKFSVCLGLATYVLKIYKEVLDSQISQGILGRCALRIVTEVYVTLKYMAQKELDNPDIWRSFKEYGIGKYKYVTLQARETSLDLTHHHLSLPIMEAILNEDKNEEFTNMDTRLFDNQNVRKKFEVINENDLYDLYYEYDTNYIHGLWGAVRESSMLFCNNPAHKYHAVPDLTFEQKLRSVEHDCEYILKKLLTLISSFYEFPDFYLDKYGEVK